MIEGKAWPSDCLDAFEFIRWYRTLTCPKNDSALILTTFFATPRCEEDSHSALFILWLHSILKMPRRASRQAADVTCTKCWNACVAWDKACYRELCLNPTRTWTQTTKKLSWILNLSFELWLMIHDSDSDSDYYELRTN